MLVEQGIIADLSSQKQQWLDTVTSQLADYGLDVPEVAYRRGAKQGLHTEHLGFILAELQYLQRAYPNMQW